MITWTVGMALYDNPPQFFESMRAIFTIESLIHHHPEVGEIIVVDNHPVAGNPIAEMPAKTKGMVRYIPMGNPAGTAAPRNRVFKEAKYDYVACMDPHVLMTHDSFGAFNRFYKERGLDCPDVIHCPMTTENRGEIYATHMNDQWRCQMWGTWGRAWINRDGIYFSALTRNDNVLEYVTLNTEGEQSKLTGKDLGLPDQLGWACHEGKLKELGCREAGLDTEPFLIPGHGMGFFGCRKKDWLPFHHGCRGFGGEEITTGYRFRKAGRQAWCVPEARWWHHFQRPAGGAVPYRLTAWDKARNYVLELRSLGLPLDPIRKEFPASCIPESEWQMILTGKEWPDQIGKDVTRATFNLTPEQSLARQMQKGGQIPAQFIQKGK